MADDTTARNEQMPDPPTDAEPADPPRDSRYPEGTQGSGISNRPIDEEQARQEKVPPRGDSKDGSHA